MSKSILFSISILLFFVLSSCDVQHTKDYYIQNKIDAPIKVEFEILNVLDSVTIPTDSQVLIYNNFYITGPSKVSDDRDSDHVSNLSFEVDSIKKSIDEEFWAFDREGKYHANYIMTIDSTFFE